MLAITLVVSLVHINYSYAMSENGTAGEYEFFHEDDYEYTTGPWDLRNFIRSIEVFDSNGDHPVLLHLGNDTLQIGSTYTLLMNFRESPAVPFQYNSDGAMVYQLPNGLRLISAEGLTSDCCPYTGTYVSADPTAGLITVWLTDTLMPDYMDDPANDDADDDAMEGEEPIIDDILTGNEEAIDGEALTDGEETASDEADTDSEETSDDEADTDSDDVSNDETAADSDDAANDETTADSGDRTDSNTSTNDGEATDSETFTAVGEVAFVYIGDFAFAEAFESLEETTVAVDSLDWYADDMDFGTDTCFFLRLVVEVTDEDYFFDFGNGFVFFPLDGEHGLMGDALPDIEAFAAGTSSDLADFITSVNIFDMDGNPITSSDPTYIGQNYRFEITFSETPTLQLAYDPVTGHLSYQLPPYLTIQNAIDVTPLYSPINSSAIIGWYTIDTTGLVQVWFNNVDLNGNPTSDGSNLIDYYSDLTITLNIYAQLTGSSDGNIDFGNNVVVTIVPPVPPAPSLTMHKASRYVPNPPTGASPSWYERIYYMITITALEGPITNITLVDFPTINGVSFNNLPTSAFSAFTYEIDRVGMPLGTLNPMAVTWSYAPALSFSYEFIDPITLTPIVLNPGDFITVRYNINIPQLIANNNGTGQPLAGMTGLIHDFVVNNSATVSGDSADTGDPVPDVSDNTTDHVHKALTLTKNGVFNGTDSITWTITVGDGVSIPLNTGTITDTITDGLLTLPPDAQIYLYFYGNSNNLLSSTNAAAFYPGLGYYTRVSNTEFTLTIPPNPPFVSVYQVVIIYSTPITPPQQGEPVDVYSNNASFQFPDGTGNYPGINITVPVRPAPVVISKTTSGICGNPDITTPDERYWVEYTITINVPGGLENQPLYLYDNLGLFPGGSGVPNVPQDLNVSVVPDPSEATIPFSATGAIPYTANSWRIFFGASGDTLPATWSWPYSLPAVLTVSYTVYLSDATVTGLQDTTTARYISNAAYLINSTGAPNIGTYGNAVGSTNVNDYWPILKHVQGTANPALFNYTVTLKGAYSARTAPLMQAGNNPVFSDTFDPGLTYVPSSFYVVDTGIAGRYFVPASDVTVSGSSFSTNFNSTDWMEYSGTFPTGTLLGPAPANWFAQRRDFTVHYQLIVSDTTTAQTNMVNTARITVNIGECAFESSQTVNFTPPETMAKNMTPVASGSNRLNVEVIINPDGQVEFSDGVNPGPPQVTAVDLLQNLMIFTDSIVIYTQTQVNGVWNGVWVPEPYTFNDRQLWSVNIVPQAQVPTGYDGEVDFVIPNATPVKITYDVGVTLPPGVAGNISNEISIFGESGSSESNDYLVGGGGAGVGAGRLDFKVFKQDNVGNNLMGATFDLYVTVMGSYQPPAGHTVDTTIIGTGGQVIQFGLLEEVTTDATGMAQFSDQWINSTYKMLYMLVETQAPYGYVPIYHDIFFTVNPTITTTEIADLNTLLAPALAPGESVNQVSDFITVENVPDTLDPGNLRIRKVFNGLTPAQIQENLQDFQLVITDPNMTEYVFTLADVLNPGGIVLQGIPQGLYLFTERNENVPNYTLTTAPRLPARSFITPNDIGEVVITIQNNYVPYPNLTLRKAFIIDGVHSNTPPPGTSLISFEIIGMDFITGAEIFRATIPYTDFVNGTYTLTNLPPGIYVIYETGGVADGFTLTTDGLLGFITLSPGMNAEIPINNIYTFIPPGETPPPTGPPPLPPPIGPPIYPPRPPIGPPGRPTPPTYPPWPPIPPTTQPPTGPPGWPETPPPDWPDTMPWPPAWTLPEPPTDATPPTDSDDLVVPRPNPQTSDGSPMASSILLLIGLAFMSLLSVYAARRFAKSK